MCFEFLKRNRVEIFAYFVCGLLSVIILVWILQLWNADLTIPFSYTGDALWESMTIKGLIDNPWWFHNNFLGMPFGTDNFDFPTTNTLDWLILKLFGVLSQNYAVSMNLFYLLTFPLTAITTLYVFRELKVSIVPSVIGSLLFTFTAYHFLRGEPHLILSSYFLIPLIILVIIWIYEGKSIIFNFENNKIDLWNRYTLVSLIICGLIAIEQIYYIYFSCFFLLVIGVIQSIKNRNKNYIITVFLLIGLMIVILLATMTPVIWYQYINGPNPDAILRSPVDSEIYGLKIVQLLIPVPNHRIPFFALINSKYSSTAPLVNENATSSLGLIGSIGFIFLIIWIFIRIEGTSFHLLNSIKNKLNCFSALNLSAVLLATIGGFSSLMAYSIFDDIRGYNRISIFITFFAIATIILLINVMQNTYCTTNRRKIIFFGLLCLLLIGGILDQTSPSWVPAYSSTKQEYMIQQQFFNDIEEKMPENAMIFQLPYVPYLGKGQNVASIPFYAEAIPYLHSKSLRWSYGGMVNREADIWLQSISQLSLEDQVKRLSYVGFDGILVDREGYNNPETGIISNLTAIFHEDPVTSIDKRYFFFDMTTYNSNLKMDMGEEKWQYEKNQTLFPLELKWTNGFSILEGSPDSNWRWCGPIGVLQIINPSNSNMTISFETTFFSGYSDNSQLEISTQINKDEVNINNSGTYYRKRMSLPPGESTIIFASDAKRVIAPGDNRILIFYLKNFRFEVEG